MAEEKGVEPSIEFSDKVSHTGKVRYKMHGDCVAAEYEHKNGSSGTVYLRGLLEALCLIQAPPPVPPEKLPERDLGTALDALNAELGEFEDWMAEQGFATRAEVVLPSGGRLIWGKAGSVWRLMYGTACHLTELRHASASRRLEAAAHAVELVSACRNGTSARAEVVQAAVVALRALRRGAVGEAELKGAFDALKGDGK